MNAQGFFPPGMYAMQVMDIAKEDVSQNNYPYTSFRVRICGTDHDCWWLVSASPNAEWVWKDYIRNYGSRHELIGRTFLFELRHDVWQDEIHERVRPVEELPSDYKPSTISESAMKMLQEEACNYVRNQGHDLRPAQIDMVYRAVAHAFGHAQEEGLIIVVPQRP